MAEFTYDVVRHRGAWRVAHIGRYSPPHPDQEAAVRAALKLAREKARSGREVEVQLLRTDGGIVPIPLTEAPESATTEPAAPTE